MKSVKQQFLESLRAEKILNFVPGASRGGEDPKGKLYVGMDNNGIVDMPDGSWTLNGFTHVKANESDVGKLFDYIVKSWDELADLIDADPKADKNDVQKRLFNFVYGSAQWYNEENHEGNKIIEFSDEDFKTVARRLHKECQDGRLSLADLIKGQER